MGGNLHKIVH